MPRTISKNKTLVKFWPWLAERKYHDTEQTKFRVDKTQNYQKFGLPIGNAKMTKKVQFHPEATLIKYHQKSSNSFCLIILASDFHCIGDNMAVTALVNRIEESLNQQTKESKNRINFNNFIVKRRRKIKGE